ncbi:hypothetical protein tb265_11840 [Gemmatimonadetes bacterium T265]|nr:hypothetical protein tb265_11840 [Gemmatimonadetes bacterium T265]
MTLRTARPARNARVLLACAVAVCAVGPLAARAAGAQRVPPSLTTGSAVGPYERARRLVEQGQGALGRAVADSLVAASPAGSPALAEALWWRATLSADGARAEQDLRRIADEFSTSPRVGDAIVRLAQLDISRDRPDVAAPALARLVRERPDDPAHAQADYWLARARLELGDTRGACLALADASAAARSSETFTRQQVLELWQRLPACDPASVVAVVPPGTPAPPHPATQTAAPASHASDDETRAPTPAAAPPAARPTPITPPATATPATITTAAATSTRPTSGSATTPARSSAAATAAPTTPAPTASRPTSSSATTTVASVSGALASSAPVPGAPAPGPSTVWTSTAKAKAAPAATPATPPPTAATPSATAPAAATPAAGGFAVQVAAYAQRDGAESLAAHLRARGFDARATGSMAPFRVKIGRYTSRTAAAAARATFAGQGLAGFVTDAGDGPSAAPQRP